MASRFVTIEVEDTATTTVVYYKGFALFPTINPNHTPDSPPGTPYLKFEIQHRTSGQWVARGVDAIAGVFAAVAFIETILTPYVPPTTPAPTTPAP